MSDDLAYPSDIAFTPAVKAIQGRKGSRDNYARMEEGEGWSTTITPAHQAVGHGLVRRRRCRAGAVADAGGMPGAPRAGVHVQPVGV
jgi:hypothetical protein